jgi:hypothetical protein
MNSAIYILIKQLSKFKLDCLRYCTTNILPPGTPLSRDQPLGMFPFRKSVVADVRIYNTSIPTTSDVLAPNASIYVPNPVFRIL